MNDTLQQSDMPFVLLSDSAAYDSNSLLQTIDPYAFLTESWDVVGEAGDPLLHQPGIDSAVAGACILCFVIIALALRNTRNQLTKIIRNLFDPYHRSTVALSALPELRFLVMLMAATAIEGGVLYYNHVMPSLPCDALSPVALLTIYSIMTLLYILFRTGLYKFANWLFFKREKGSEWMDIFVFLEAATAVVLFPVVLLQSFAAIPPTTFLAILIVMLGGVKILSFNKSADIFFSKNVLSLHNFLYFCTLEAAPIVLLVYTWGLIPTF